MKTGFIIVLFLLAGDLAMFSGANTHQLWSATKAQLKSIQTYADQATGSFLGN